MLSLIVQSLIRKKRQKDQRQGTLGKKHKDGHLGVGVKCEDV